MKKRQPICTYVLVILNVLIFFLLECLGDTNGDVTFMVEHGAMHISALQEGKEYWRFVSSMFLHFGFEHLLNNMLLLLVVGSILEKATGSLTFLCIYLLSGIGGDVLSLTQMHLSRDYKVSAGASGAILGLVGGLLWVVLRHKGRYESLTKNRLLFMIVLVLYSGFRSPGVDNWGHIGGLCAGFFVCMILYRKREKAVDLSDESPYT